MKKAPKWLYVFSFISWIISLSSVVLVFIGIPYEMIVVMFIFVLFSAVTQELILGRNAQKPTLISTKKAGNAVENLSKETFDKCVEPKKQVEKARADRALSIMMVISQVFIGICLLSLFIAGGGPRIIDGEYWIVSHGELICTVAKNLFIYLTICERLLVAFGVINLATATFSKTRTAYLVQ